MFDWKKSVNNHLGGGGGGGVYIIIVCLPPYNSNFCYFASVTLKKISSPYDFEFTRLDCINVGNTVLIHLIKSNQIK